MNGLPDDDPYNCASDADEAVKCLACGRVLWDRIWQGRDQRMPDGAEYECGECGLQPLCEDCAWGCEEHRAAAYDRAIAAVESQYAGEAGEVPREYWQGYRPPRQMRRPDLLRLSLYSFLLFFLVVAYSLIFWR